MRYALLMLPVMVILCGKAQFAGQPGFPNRLYSDGQSLTSSRSNLLNSFEFKTIFGNDNVAMNLFNLGINLGLAALRGIGSFLQNGQVPFTEM